MNPSDVPAEMLFTLLGRYFWAFILVSQIALARREWKLVSERYLHDPDLIARYRRLFRGFLFWANLPWVLMGFLILTDRVRDVFSFLPPGQDEPWVVIWLASLFLLLLIASFWIYFRKGAQTLAAHPGIPYVPRASSAQIKLIWALLAMVVTGAIVFRAYPALPKGPDVRHFIAFFAPALFVCFWFLIVWIIGKTGGWNKLAAQYEFKGKFPGRLFSAGGQVGVANYGGILRLGADKEGFYLGVIFMFRIAHPPLYIPWQDVRAEEQKAFFMTNARLSFAKVPDMTLRIPKSAALKLKELSGTRNALPEIQS